MPEPPKLPKDLADELAACRSIYDSHAEGLKAWAEMAAIFHRQLRESFEPALADSMLLAWQRVWFEWLYGSGMMVEGDETGEG